MHKKDVLIAIVPLFDVMEKQPYLDNAFNVYAVNAPLSGKPATTVPTTVSTGLSCGLPRVIPSGGFANFLVIVLLHLTTLRTIGLTRYPKKKTIIPKSSICFMMQPTFTRTAVC